VVEGFRATEVANPECGPLDDLANRGRAAVELVVHCRLTQRDPDEQVAATRVRIIPADAAREVQAHNENTAHTYIGSNMPFICTEKDSNIILSISIIVLLCCSHFYTSCDKCVGRCNISQLVPSVAPYLWRTSMASATFHRTTRTSILFTGHYVSLAHSSSIT
jgi:hypothetical protein